VQHLASKKPAKCAICGKDEETAGTFPMVVGVGRICLTCGMEKVVCEVCGTEVKRLTSSRFNGKTLCLRDHMKEIEKYKQHVARTFDEETQPLAELFRKALAEGPEGYTLVSLRRERASTHVWEAEYEKTEVFQLRCG
jgi:hypothetical protein